MKRRDMAETCRDCYREKYCDHTVAGYQYNSLFIHCPVSPDEKKLEKTTFALKCPTNGILAMNIAFIAISPDI
jgi:hypothetical protein